MGCSFCWWPLCTRGRTGWCGLYPVSGASNECALHHQWRADCRTLRLPALRDVQAGEVLMTPAALALLAALMIALLLCVKPLGLYIAHVMEGKRTWALRVGGPLESWIYRLGGIDPGKET